MKVVVRSDAFRSAGSFMIEGEKVGNKLKVKKIKLQNKLKFL